MTVIAYRNGVIAADRGVTGSDIWKGSGPKLSRSPAGSIAAACGEYSLCGAFHELVEIGAVDKWLSQAKGSIFAGLSAHPGVEKVSSFGAIVVDHRGEVFLVDHWGWLCAGIEAEFHADGSGREFALGAMAAGADPVRACQIACELDLTCRGPVDVMRLNCI